MSDEIRHEMTGLLAAQVDSFAEVIEQRDLARSVAVGLEGEVHALEIERDALLLRIAAVEKIIDDTQNGEYATKGRDFGRGVAYLAHAVGEVLSA